MGSTSTSTLGMRLSCNFVSGYTIAYRVAYRVQYTYTFTRVHGASLTDILARKSAHVGQVGG